MKKTVINTVKCCPESVGARKGSFELFGYDFLLDE